jgi:Fe-S oxidoreductase
VEQVAAYIPTRTKPLGGLQDEETFTADTRPTATQVTLLAQQSANKVLVAVGSDLPDYLKDAASSVAAVLAASDVELRYFPEQLNTDQSPYDLLVAKFDKELGWLVAQIEKGTEVPGDGGEIVTPGMPAYGFPAPGAPASGVWW